MNLRTLPHDSCRRPHCSVCGTPPPKRKPTRREIAGVIAFYGTSFALLVLVVLVAAFPR